MAMENSVRWLFLLKPQFWADFQLPRLITGGYLVGGWAYPSERMKVTQYDEIPTWMEKIQMFQTITRMRYIKQYWLYMCIYLLYLLWFFPAMWTKNKKHSQLGAWSQIRWHVKHTVLEVITYCCSYIYIYVYMYTYMFICINMCVYIYIYTLICV